MIGISAISVHFGEVEESCHGLHTIQQGIIHVHYPAPARHSLPAAAPHLMLLRIYFPG
jgi:hypothetical protein